MTPNEMVALASVAGVAIAFSSGSPDWWSGTVQWIPREGRTRLRVTWRSELGTPKKFETNWETYRGLPL